MLLSRKDNLLNWLGGDITKSGRILGADIRNGVDTVKIEQELVTQKIDQAIDHIHQGDFGKCTQCSGEVEEERLALDFTTCVCLDHYSEKQLRDLERDLELAAKVQKMLLPQAIPALPGIQLAVRSEPSKIVGGDYFDFFTTRENRQAFTIADVMGKGLPASMLMSNLQASLRILGPENESLEKTISRLNELFRFNLKMVNFITLFMAAIDMENHILKYCNAGHNPPLWFKPAAGEFEFLNPTGPALAIFTEPEYKTGQIEFHSGDIFLFFTDGLSEAKNDREEFGEKRLQDYLMENQDKTAQQILTGTFRSVKKFASAETDDMTAIVLKIE